MNDEDINDLIAIVEMARGALADIAFSPDVTLEVVRKKAERVYLLTNSCDAIVERLEKIERK